MNQVHKISLLVRVYMYGVIKDEYVQCGVVVGTGGTTSLKKGKERRQRRGSYFVNLV